MPDQYGNLTEEELYGAAGGLAPAPNITSSEREASPPFTNTESTQEPPQSTPEPPTTNLDNYSDAAIPTPPGGRTDGTYYRFPANGDLVFIPKGETPPPELLNSSLRESAPLTEESVRTATQILQRNAENEQQGMGAAPDSPEAQRVREAADIVQRQYEQERQLVSSGQGRMIIIDGEAFVAQPGLEYTDSNGNKLTPQSIPEGSKAIGGGKIITPEMAKKQEAETRARVAERMLLGSIEYLGGIEGAIEAGKTELVQQAVKQGLYNITDPETNQLRSYTEEDLSKAIAVAQAKREVKSWAPEALTPDGKGIYLEKAIAAGIGADTLNLLAPKEAVQEAYKNLQTKQTQELIYGPPVPDYMKGEHPLMSLEEYIAKRMGEEGVKRPVATSTETMGLDPETGMLYTVPGIKTTKEQDEYDNAIARYTKDYQTVYGKTRMAQSAMAETVSQGAGVFPLPAVGKLIQPGGNLSKVTTGDWVWTGISIGGVVLPKVLEIPAVSSGLGKAYSNTVKFVLGEKGTYAPEGEADALFGIKTATSPTSVGAIVKETKTVVVPVTEASGATNFIRMPANMTVEEFNAWMNGSMPISKGSTELVGTIDAQGRFIPAKSVIEAQAIAEAQKYGEATQKLLFDAHTTNVISPESLGEARKIIAQLDKHMPTAEITRAKQVLQSRIEAWPKLEQELRAGREAVLAKEGAASAREFAKNNPDTAELRAARDVAERSAALQRSNTPENRAALAAAKEHEARILDSRNEAPQTGSEKSTDTRWQVESEMEKQRPVNREVPNRPWREATSEEIHNPSPNKELGWDPKTQRWFVRDAEQAPPKPQAKTLVKEEVTTKTEPLTREEQVRLEELNAKDNMFRTEAEELERLALEKRPPYVPSRAPTPARATAASPTQVATPTNTTIIGTTLAGIPLTRTSIITTAAPKESTPETPNEVPPPPSTPGHPSTATPEVEPIRITPNPAEPTKAPSPGTPHPEGPSRQPITTPTPETPIAPDRQPTPINPNEPQPEVVNPNVAEPAKEPTPTETSRPNETPSTTPKPEPTPRPEPQSQPQPKPTSPPKGETPPSKPPTPPPPLKTPKLGIIAPRLSGGGSYYGVDGGGLGPRVPDGTVVWKMGRLWKRIEPGYTQRKPLTSFYPPLGVTKLEGTPQETLTFIGGKIPFTNIDFDLGITDGFIDVQKKQIVFKGGGLKTNVGQREPSNTRGLTIRETTPSVVRIRSRGGNYNAHDTYKN